MIFDFCVDSGKKSAPCCSFNRHCECVRVCALQKVIYTVGSNGGRVWVCASIDKSGISVFDVRNRKQMTQ